jgi:hypothetical protein
MATRKIETIQVPSVDSGLTIPVTVEVKYRKGDYAVHKSIRPWYTEYNVTHVPSGVMMPCGIGMTFGARTIKEAKHICNFWAANPLEDQPFEFGKKPTFTEEFARQRRLQLAIWLNPSWKV